MAKSKVYTMPKKHEVNISANVKKLSGPQQLNCDLIDWAQSTACDGQLTLLRTVKRKC